MNVKHFYLESFFFVTLIGIFSYNFNKSDNAHPKVWLHTLRWRPVGWSLSGELSAFQGLQRVPRASGGHLTIAAREKEKLFVPLELAFQGAKIASRRLAVRARRSGEACPVEEGDGRSLGATLPLTLVKTELRPSQPWFLTGRTLGLHPAAALGAAVTDSGGSASPTRAQGRVPVAAQSQEVGASRGGEVCQTFSAILEQVHAMCH